MSDQEVPPVGKPEDEQNPNALLDEAGKKISEAAALITDGAGSAVQAMGIILANAIRRATAPAPKKPEAGEPAQE